MFFHRALIVLLAGLLLAIVGFAVAMGGYALAHATGDAVGASALWRVAMAVLMLGVADMLLLVLLLGTMLLRRDERDDQT